MSELARLKPTESRRVMDLVKEAGVDVSDWANFKGGRKGAAANPKYCYEWAFVQPGKVVVLNLWHSQLRPRHGTLVVDFGVRRYALQHPRGRAGEVLKRRAEKMGDAIRLAFTHGLPVRVVVVDGTRRSWSDPNPTASRVDRRKLDPVRWAVTAYDLRTGRGRLTRRASPTRGIQRASSFSRIRSSLRQLADEVCSALMADPRAQGLALIRPTRRRTGNDQTGGYWTALGRLTRHVSIEIWLDHFSGLPAPRAWVGFSARSGPHLSTLLTLPPLAQLSKRVIRRAGGVTRRSFYHFKDPLRPAEFDVPVHERYDSYQYLGVYYPYPWPFSQGDRRALVREAVNLIATLYAAHLVKPTKSINVHAPGPWARPDPRTERAAVRHVFRHLRSQGYAVRSREREICGYDLHATRGHEELHVEVKGAAGPVPRFFISRTELSAGKADPRWRLAIVTNASRKPPRPRLMAFAEMRSHFDLEPTTWAGLPKGE